MEQLTDEEIEQIKRIFYGLDMDGTGFIKVDELGSVMKALGQNYTEDELNEILIEFDTDPKGYIDESQCVNMVAYKFSRLFSPVTTAAILELKSPSLESFLTISSEEMDDLEAEIVTKHLKKGIHNALHSRDLGTSEKLVDSVISMYMQEFIGGLPEKNRKLNESSSTKILGFLNLTIVVFLFIFLVFCSGAKDTYYPGLTPT